MTITIGILDIHDGYGDETWFYNNFTYSKLSEELKDNLELKQIETINDLFNSFQLFGITPDKSIGISDVDYNESYVYQTIYAQADDTTNSEFNKLATQIVRDVNVNGRMIFIKRNLIDESYENFTLFDFIDIVHNVFIRDGIEININGDCRQIEYITDVLENQIYKDTYDNIRYYEHKLLEYVLTFYINKCEEQVDDNLNIYATAIYGKKIYGKVVLTLTDHQDEHPRCVNLTEKEFKKIYHLYKNKIEIDRSKYGKKLTLEDLNLNNMPTQLNKINGFPNITYNPNFYSIISQEYFQYKNLDLALDLKDFPVLHID